MKAPASWHRVKEVFHAALDRQPASRAAFVRAQCEGDPALQREVESLLIALDQAGSFVARPVLETVTASTTEVPSTTFQPGDRIASYHITAFIAAGGMGEVYRARDERLQRDVAIKILQPERAGDEAARRRLLGEARAAAALNHPAICTVYEVGEAQNHSYIAMEFVEGQTLAALLDGAPLSARDVVKLGTALADAVAHAHARGIVHGDLKPANVIVTRDGRVKVLDFGLARRVETLQYPITRADLSFRATGAAGTLAYMAPEQLQGHSADTRSDVWALGVIVYEMTTGRRPFIGSTECELVWAICAGSAATIPPLVTAALRSAIERCLEKSPECRYATAADLQSALIAVHDTMSEQRAVIRRRSVPLQWAVATGLVVLTLLALAATALTRGARPAALTSIAVLPFKNANGDAAYRYVAETIGDAVGENLGAIRSLTVMAGEATERYGKTTQTPAEIGRELDASALLEGSTLVSGDRVRIVVRLIEAASQRPLWANTYDAETREVLTVSKSIARAIATEVQATLTTDEQWRMNQPARAVNPAVLNLLNTNQYGDTRSVDDFLGKRKYIERAIELDPDYAPAYISLFGWYRTAVARALLGPPTRVYETMRGLLAQAREKDPDLDLSFQAGALSLLADWDWAGASTQYARTLDLYPNRPGSHNAFRYLWTLTGRYDDALVEAEHARRLFPTNPNFVSEHLWVYLSARRYGDVIEQSDRERLTDINNLMHRAGWRWRVVAEVMTGRTASASKWCDGAVPLSGNDRRTLSICGFVFARAGNTTAAKRILDTLIRHQADGAYVDPFLIATVEAGLGRRNEMFASLGRAADERSPLIIELTTAPWLDAFHDDVRYQQLVQRIGFVAGAAALKSPLPH